MREIEVLVKLFDGKKKVLKALRGFKREGANRILDIYYTHPKLTVLRPERSGRLRDCLRIRVKGDKCLIAYKKDYFNQKDMWLYSEEHETPIEGFKEISHILAALGFKVLIRVDNTKHKFMHGDYEIVLEEVKGLGLFLEVEYKKQSRASHKEIKNDICSFISSMGVRFEELNMGKPEMLLRKKRLDKS